MHQLTFWPKLQYAPQMKGLFMLILKMMVLHASADFLEKSADMAKITICTSNERSFHADSENDGFACIS